MRFKSSYLIAMLTLLVVSHVFAQEEAEEDEEDGSQGFEALLFTGTNLDLLDGVKAKELYFKGSILVNFKKDKELTKSFGYITFGKNRYFTDKDSLGRQRFWMDMPSAKPGDSITIVQGVYNSFKEKATDNIFCSLDYLYQFNQSEDSRLFATAGMYVSLQTIKSSFSNTNFLTDTTTYLRVQDSSYTFRTPFFQRVDRQFNINYQLGIMHILTTKNLNIKTHATVGINRFSYPYSSLRRGDSEMINYRSTVNFFGQLKIDATVLKGGLSIGFEAFIRASTIPLFNVSLTKALDFDQIGSLFGKVDTVKD